MKRKNFIYSKGSSSEVNGYVLKLAEKNDDPDIWLGFLETDNTIEQLKNKKEESRENKKEENNNETGSNSLSDVISKIIVPAVASVAIASLGLVPGFDGLDSVNAFNSNQNSINASIISIDQNYTNAKYNINLDFDTDIDEKFDLNDENVVVTLTNDFVNCEQAMKYNNTGPSEQEYPIEQKQNSKIISKYTIKQNSEEVLKKDEGSSKHSFTINGFIDGLNQNMKYTLAIKGKGKVLAKQEFKTKSEKDKLPFEIVNTEIKIDTYKDIASFEILMNTRNWDESVNFNDEEFVLRLSNNQNYVDFKISNNYSYVLKQNVELIYDLSQNQIGANNTMFTFRGDISKLMENTNYTMTLLRKNDKIIENSFETKSILKGLEFKTETNYNN